MKLAIFGKIQTKDYFPTKSTLRYFEWHVLSRIMVFYGPCKMAGDKLETDTMFPTLVKLD